MTDDNEERPRSSIHGVFSSGRTARAKSERLIEGLEVVDEAGVAEDAVWATMRRYAAGVTVVTAVEDGAYIDITVSAFCLVSLNPPLILVSLHEGSQVLDAIQAGDGGFAVSLLSGRQELLADMFAGRAPRPDPAFRTIPHRTIVTGAPVLTEGLAWLDCRLSTATPAGDHMLILGNVVAIGVHEGSDDPLLYFGSQYRRLAP